MKDGYTLHDTQLFTGESPDMVAVERGSLLDSTRFLSLIGVDFCR